MIEREVTIGGIRLIQGDMRKVLPLLDLRADMVMSDPPYLLTSGGTSSVEMGGNFAKDQYDNSGALFDIVPWSEMAPLIISAMADNSSAMIMTSDREEGDARAAFLSAGLRFHRLLVWNKITATPNRFYMPNCEFALYLFKGRARRINDCGSKALITCPQRDVSHLYLDPDLPPESRLPHPTEKPVGLMEYWIGNSTDPGALVLDPFMGSGSTVVAAARIGRRAVGIEKNPKWFDVACKRLAEVSSAPRFAFDAFEMGAA
jgi:site-specific DNA-methyltransferase (adenine-specific)